MQFVSYLRKFRREQLQSHIWLTASSYMTKYLRISSYMQLFPSKSLYIWGKSYFLFYQCAIAVVATMIMATFVVIVMALIMVTVGYVVAIVVAMIAMIIDTVMVMVMIMVFITAEHAVSVVVRMITCLLSWSWSVIMGRLSQSNSRGLRWHEVWSTEHINVVGMIII